MDADVKNAIIELAGFYGMSVGDEYIKAIIGGKNSNDAIEKAANEVKANPVSPFNEDKKKFKLIAAISEEIKQITDVQKKITITPDSDDSGSDIDASLRNAPGAPGQIPGDQGKGEPANGEYYTMDELRPATSRSTAGVITGEPPVHVIQAFKSDHAPTSANTEMVALWLNSIPANEMSRAIPLLDIRISLPGGGDDSNLYAGAKPMSLFSFVNGNNQASDAAKKIMKSDFLENIVDGQRTLQSPTDNPVNKRIVSSMEVFTSPQTLLGAKRSNLSDPFRPFMSFESLSISHTPAGGMMSFQTAEMNLKLHDRTRLNDVLGLVAPTAIGKTQIEIHYGWSHPQHNNLMRPSDSDVNNRYAKLINAQRSVEIYNVTNSDYTFNDSGEVEITVNLALAGSNVAATAEITDSVAEDKEKALDKLFQSIRTLIANLRSGPKVGRISFPSYVTAASSLGGANKITRADRRKLSNFIARARGSSNPDLKSLGQELGKVYGSSGDSFENFRKHKVKILNDLITMMKKNPDPFLPTRNFGNITLRKMRQNGKNRDRVTQTYASFGKLFSIFVAEAFKTKGQQFSEIQVIFYPINESASYASSFNLAQFPILISDFSTIMTQKMDPIQKMTIGRFLNIINSYYLRDQANAAYGMNSLFGSRVKKDGEQTTERKRLRAVRENDQFAAAKLNILKEAYGLDDTDSDFTFRMPQVTIKYECAPADDKTNPKAAPILRIHVMDQAAGKAEQLKDVLMAFGGDGTFVEKVRKNEPDTARTPGHGEVVTKNLETLKDLIEEQTVDDDKKVYVIKTNSDATGLAFDLKEKIKSMFPTVTYGAANSNMTNASLSTVSDSSMNTIMMMRQDSADADNDAGQEGGLPLQIMPTQLSIETLGCPYVSFGQQLFVDFNTGTTADNFYAVVGIKHELSSGEFKTDIDMVQLDGFGTFRSALGNLRKAKAALETLQNSES